MERIKAWFRHSWTIFWARVQLILAALWGVLTTVDLTPVLSQKWLTVWLIVSGTVTELARRQTLDKDA